jgi:hypothetical protein
MAVNANAVPVVVNCYDVAFTIPYRCKSDIHESYNEDEFVRILILELLHIKQGGIPYCLPTLYQIQH